MAPKAVEPGDAESKPRPPEAEVDWEMKVKGTKPQLNTGMFLFALRYIAHYSEYSKE